MEFQVSVLLFLLSPCLCIRANPYFNGFLTRYLRHDDHEDSPAGELVAVSSLRSFSREDWNSLYSLSLTDDDPSSAAELAVTNNLNDASLLLCWVDCEGGLHNFSPLNDKSIQDGSVSNCHVENTFNGHAFVCFHRSDPIPACLSEVRNEDLVFSYRLRRGGIRHSLTLSSSRFQSAISIQLKTEALPPKEEMIDSSNKEYKCMQISGFTVYYEAGLFEYNPAFHIALVDDLEKVCSLLPKRALKCIQECTPFYLNKTFIYGRKSRPVIAKGCCFHPREGADWLRFNGHSVHKCGGVEIYDADAYLLDRNLWGYGGILVHELSHAYHNKFCPNGFNCKEILEAYHRAMNLRLYDCVAVHSKRRNGSPTKAYACTNAMEFWAELSTAYHFEGDEITEYNKWFPHNRFQLIQHDLETFFLLDKLWNGP